MLFAGFLFSAVGLLFPSLIYVLVGNTSFLVLPIGVALQVALFSSFACVLPLQLGAVERCFASLLLSLCLTLVLLRRYGYAIKATPFKSKASLWILALSFLAILDGFLIYSKQGWHLDTAQTYFRPPFNNDVLRNVALISSLLRGGGNPFLPDSELHYQVFWHEGAALIVGVLSAWLQPLSLYELTAGLSLAYALIFFLVLLSILAWLRPSWFFRPLPALFMTLLLASHAELFNVGLSWLRSGHWGIEADWSVSQPIYFRFISLKLLSLIAPQHAFCVGFLALCFAGAQFFKKSQARIQKIFCALAYSCAFLSAPLLAVAYLVGIPFFRGKKELWRIPGYLFTGIVSYRLFLKAWPFALFSGNRSEKLVFFLRNRALWNFFPLEWVAAIGVLGLALLVFFIFDTIKRKKISVHFPLFAACTLLLLLSNHSWSNPELRRHIAILVALFGSFLAVKVLPRRPLVYSALLLLVPLHFYFLLCFTVKPSVMDPHIVWRDYFAINKILLQKFRGVSVLSAWDAEQGVGMPPVLEASSAWAGLPSARAHGRLSETQMGQMAMAEKLGSILPVAIGLGFELIEWGPFEEATWSQRVKKRFVSENELVARVGKVSLYRLKDQLLNDEAATSFQRAENLRGQQWISEALEFYKLALREDPTQWRAQLGLGLCESVLENFSGAVGALTKAFQLSPQSAEVLFHRGVALSKMGRAKDALRDFEAVEKIDPSHFGVQNNLRALRQILNHS